MILSIDQGISNVGVSLIDYNNILKETFYLDLNGHTDAKSVFIINLKLQELIDKYDIEYIVTEELYISNKNGKAGGVKKALYATGAIMLTASLNNIQFATIHPKTVKKLITGNGSAKKEEIMKVLETYDVEFENDHQSDSLAICIAFNKKLRGELVG